MSSASTRAEACRTQPCPPGSSEDSVKLPPPVTSSRQPSATVTGSSVSVRWLCRPTSASVRCAPPVLASAVRSASSSIPVPGSTTASYTRWSRTQGMSAGASSSRPVQEPCSVTDGTSRSSSPAPLPARRRPCSTQCTARCHGYGGTGAQALRGSAPNGSRPLTYARATDSRSVSGEPWSRRSVDSTCGGTGRCAANCSSAGVSTGCGLISTTWVTPVSNSRSIASANITGRRRLSTQYRASNSGPSSGATRTVDISSTPPRPGRTDRSAASRSSSSSSICGLCEA